MQPKYNFSSIEKKWQRIWKTKKVYEPDLKKAKRPFYNLMMFPYPSAEGLHVGNMYAFTGSDIYGRFMRMRGHDVFEPIGLDGFGIHSENYALKIGAHPMRHAEVSEKRFYKQLEMIGNGFAWNEKIETYDPAYYTWTQWIFTEMWRRGLAYRKKQAVNWCPSCKTVLADEQVISGKCERCSSVVVKKELEQWFFRITKYAERLLTNTEKLDWSEKVKIAQRNWIGKSEGARIDFKIRGTDFMVEVFTTRPDTLFGATYVVLAPESPLITALELKIKNRDAVARYVRRARGRAEADRIAEGREKTGVELKGVKAVNPATKEDIPVWVADYVLGHVGTGAIMAVPAHDERDHEFAKKYKLPTRVVIEPETGAPLPNEEYRRSIVAIVEDPRAKKFLTINWGPKLGGTLFIGGGREKSEDEVRTALREIKEETGYANLAFMRKTELMHHHYVAFSKNHVARNIEVTGLHFRLKDGARTRRNLQHDEKGNFTIEWLARDEILQKMEDENHLLCFRRLVLGEIYTGAGKLTGSGKFGRMDSEKAKWAITKSVGGTRTVQYRLRDWLISRQRYWGPPIPMIFCGACARAGRGEQKEMPGWYAVPEGDLPVKLPFVKDFRPKGKGESPLASVASFYKTKCPACGGPARRETDVSDTFLDSAWYYLRYLDPKNPREPFDKLRARKWLPVGMYIGGAEHSVLHLLYVRFVAMALHDWGLVRFSAKGGSASGGGEPFAKFRAHGLLIKEGGKMSKSKGNVVNPDEYIGKFGADALRMYLMFLAPFEQGGDFRDGGILGITRFLERVWKFGLEVGDRHGHAGPGVAPRYLHQAVKKITEDIEGIRYNTAISALMILLRRLEDGGGGAKDLSVFLRLLAPFAPHLTEELWARAGNTRSIHREPWPSYDVRLLKERVVTLVIQVNGKVRDTVEVDAGIGEGDARAIALARERVRPFLEGKKPKKVIYVPKRLVNIVV